MPKLEPPLMRKKRRALHEKHRERRHPDVAHAKGRIHTTPLVRKPVQAASQRPKQGIEQTHAPDESHSRVLANPLFWCGQTFHPNCCIRDSPPLPRQRLNRIENCCRSSVTLDKFLLLGQALETPASSAAWFAGTPRQVLDYIAMLEEIANKLAQFERPCPSSSRR